MNKIKFRVWDVDGKIFVPPEFAALRCDGQFLSLQELDGRNAYTEDEIKVIVEMSAGMHDQIGVEIFAGDILFCKREHMVGSVVFDGSSFMTNCRGWGDENLSDTDPGELLVIGNIHENPERLEE